MFSIINSNLWPALVLAAITFGIGIGTFRVGFLGKATLGLNAVAGAFLFVSFLYPIAYTGLFDQSVWYQNFRYWPGTEILAGLSGFAMARLSGGRPGRDRFVVGLLVLGLTLVPFIKPLVLPLNVHQIKNTWRNGVCIQSTLATCGPCTMATLVKHLGGKVTEIELAREAFTYRRGTEQWYLRRAVESRGYRTWIQMTDAQPETLPYPSLAGTRLGGEDGSGHFIAVLGKEGNRYLIGDPLFGLRRMPFKALRETFYFTGFFLLIQRRPMGE